jgi:hypothetical protein
MFKIYKNLLKLAMVASIVLFISACSSSSSDSDSNSDSGVKFMSKNVALSVNGANISANPTTDAANIIDNSSVTYWNSGVDGTFTISLKEAYNIKNITVHADSTGSSGTNPDIEVFLSADGVNYKTTAQVFGGDLPCLSSSIGSGKIFCSLTKSFKATHFKINVQNSKSFKFYKIELINQENAD